MGGAVEQVADCVQDILRARHVAVTQSVVIVVRTGAASRVVVVVVVVVAAFKK
eukprot:SAG22_NODE_4158_length_1364_cov_52.807115_2_plen_53_part_00